MINVQEETIFKKILNALKKIPNIYYNWRRRNEKLIEFLNNSEKNCSQINHIDATVTKLDQGLTEVKNQVSSLENRVDQINGRLETIGKGTKMELFDTLHNWRILLVKERKWASAAEKKEVEEIWNVYHFELGGNGQGQRYYNEIMELPESEEELTQKQ